MTNADRIRSMTDDELAELLIKDLPYECSEYCDSCKPGCGFVCQYGVGHNLKFMKKWLADNCEE